MGEGLGVASLASLGGSRARSKTAPASDPSGASGGLEATLIELLAEGSGLQGEPDAAGLRPPRVPGVEIARAALVLRPHEAGLFEEVGQRIALMPVGGCRRPDRLWHLKPALDVGSVACDQPVQDSRTLSLRSEERRVGQE